MPRVSVVALLLACGILSAADPPKANEYLEFVRAQAAALRANDRPPATREAWERQRADLRTRLLDAWGGFPAEACPLEPKVLGTLKRDGYRVEMVVFQTMPGVWMTANAYVPDRPGKLPAVLMVHGHWKGAKQDPVVQARCIGAAKLGFFVLVVDAFGAGERGVGTALGEYHGEMTAATLLPVGKPLSGVQVYENMRAVDYLRTRPEVDGDRIGVTGASGGGNQTMYAGGWDDRLKAAVPVCSVGNYQAYLGAACCMCEVVPGALRFTEEWGVLGLAAPKGLMVVSATKDAPQFSVGEAKKSVAGAEPVFKLFDRAANVRQVVFESPHAYNQPMREAMYGWMTRHLKGEGDGSPIPEPAHKPEDPEALRCYPGDTRPKDFVTVPKFAAAEAKRALASRAAATPEERRAALVRALGGMSDRPGPEDLSYTEDGGVGTLRFSPEPGLTLTARVSGAGKPTAPVAVVLNLDDGHRPVAGPWAKALQAAGYRLVTVDLRATGPQAWPTDRVGRAPDHTTAEWGLWIGRPLLGQWALDVRRLLDALPRAGVDLTPGVAVVGEGPAGLVALAAAASDPRVTKVAAVGTLASYVTDEPYVGQRLGTLVPGILKTVGDVTDLAALAAPRRVVIAGGVTGGGRPLTEEQLKALYPKSGGPVVTGSTDPAAVVEALRK